MRNTHFKDFSSAYKYTVTLQLAVWDRQLGGISTFG
jgi:hypothetical protein